MANITHYIDPDTRSCVMCGDDAEWLTDRGRDPIAYIPAGTLVAWPVREPGNGIVDELNAPTYREAVNELRHAIGNGRFDRNAYIVSRPEFYGMAPVVGSRAMMGL